jgi:hypothetical protein
MNGFGSGAVTRLRRHTGFLLRSLCGLVAFVLFVPSCSKNDGPSAEDAQRHPASAQTGEKRETHPVHWTEQLNLNMVQLHALLNKPLDIVQLDALLDKPVDISRSDWYGRGELYLTSPDDKEQRVLVTTGRQWFDLKRKGFFPYTTYDITMEAWFKASCEPLLYLKKATPPRISYLADFRLDADPLKNLPPSLGPIISGDTERDVEEGVAKGMTWADLFPETVVESATPTEIRLMGGDFLVVLSLIAWGDFNGDGLEDVLLFRSFHVTVGTLRYYEHVVLTRHNREGRLLVVPMDVYNEDSFLGGKRE